MFSILKLELFWTWEWMCLFVSCNFFKTTLLILCLFPSFPHYAVIDADWCLLPWTVLSFAVHFNLLTSLGIHILEDKLWHAFHFVWYVFFPQASDHLNPSCSFCFSILKKAWLWMGNLHLFQCYHVITFCFWFCFLILLAFHWRANASNFLLNC